MSPSFAANFMRIIAVISLVTAPMFAFASIADPTGLNNLFLHSVSSGEAGLAGITTQEARTSLAIAGGIFAGFAAFLLFVTAPGIKRGDRNIVRGSQIAILIWFVVDSGASIASGNPANAGANIIFLILFSAPLVLVWKNSSVTATS